MAVHSAAGTTLHICAGDPPTFDISGYATLFGSSAEELVGEITDLGEFGREYVLITHNPIGTRSTKKFKGSFNEGSMQLTLGLDQSDAGQLIMQTASASDDNYSFKVTDQTGDIYYFQAQVMSFKIGLGSVDNVVSATCTLEITSSSTGIGVITDIYSGA